MAYLEDRAAISDAEPVTIAVIAAEPFGLAARSPRAGALAAPDVARGAALRLALDVRTLTSSSISAIALGGDRAVVMLRRLLARGADRAVHLEAHAPALDLEAVVARFAAAVGRAPVVVAERQSRDDRFVAPMLAERLGATLVSRVRKVERIGDGRVVVLRERDGRVERVSACLPAVLVPAATVSAPPPPRVRELLAAEEAQITRVEPLESDIESKPLVRVMKIHRTPLASVRETIAGSDVEETAKALASRLCELLDEEAAS
jgi:electron transfer flavoprotein beta subunit